MGEIRLGCTYAGRASIKVMPPTYAAAAAAFSIDESKFLLLKASSSYWAVNSSDVQYNG